MPFRNCLILQEAQSLISKRTINARAIFEQNSAAGQLTNLGRRASFQPSNDTPKGSKHLSLDT